MNGGVALSKGLVLDSLEVAVTQSLPKPQCNWQLSTGLKDVILVKVFEYVVITLFQESLEEINPDPFQSSFS